MNVTRIVPATIQTAISGVMWADLSRDGSVSLVYTDGRKETARLSDAQIAEGRRNFFRFVSGVQEKRHNPAGAALPL